MDNHIAKEGTPTMGGIAFVLASLISFFICNGFNMVNSKTLSVIFAYICFFIVGVIDDYLKLKTKKYGGLKGSIRIILEITICMYSILILKGSGFSLDKLYIPLLRDFISASFLFIPIFVFVLVGTANSINLTDGLDGLASGLSMIAFSPFILIGLLSYNYQLTLLLTSTVGALIGFLYFNFHPAKIFMGDCGSLALGALLGLTSIVLESEFVLATAGIVFVLETLSVIIQVIYYKLTKKRIFLMSPLHHHFEKKGWQEWKVVMVFYLVGCFASIIAIIIEVI